MLGAGFYTSNAGFQQADFLPRILPGDGVKTIDPVTRDYADVAVMSAALQAAFLAIATLRDSAALSIGKEAFVVRATEDGVRIMEDQIREALRALVESGRITIKSLFVKQGSNGLAGYVDIVDNVGTVGRIQL